MIFIRFCGPQALIGQGRKSRPHAENKTVTDKTFIRFRGPQALKDMDEFRAEDTDGIVEFCWEQPTQLLRHTAAPQNSAPVLKTSTTTASPLGPAISAGERGRMARRTHAAVSRPFSYSTKAIVSVG